MIPFNYLIPSGNQVQNCILYRDDDEGCRTIRSQYADLPCPRRTCGKLDEYAALSRGVDTDVKIRSARDFLETFDNFICVSQRFRDVLKKQKASGMDFIDLLGSPGRAIMIPKLIVSVDLSRSGMTFRRPCPMCGRYRESVGLPILPSMLLPKEPNVLFQPDIRPEGSVGRMSVWIASTDLFQALKEARITGIDWES